MRNRQKWLPIHNDQTGLEAIQTIGVIAVSAVILIGAIKLAQDGDDWANQSLDRLQNQKNVGVIGLARTDSSQTNTKNQSRLAFNGPNKRANNKKNNAKTRSSRNTKKSGADAAAKLKRPPRSRIRERDDDLARVRRLSKQFNKSKQKMDEATRKQKNEELRLKKEKVILDIVKEFGVGTKHTSGLEFSNRASGNAAETSGTFVTVFDGALERPGFAASVIMHESSHAQRNKELHNAGVDRNRFSMTEEAIWMAIIEIEGYQLEIDNAAKTGLTQDEIRGAKDQRDRYLRELEMFTNKKTRKQVENGELDKVRAKFIADQKKLQQQTKPKKKSSKTS